MKKPKLHTVLEQIKENGVVTNAITRSIDGMYHLYHITENGDWVRVKSGNNPLKLEGGNKND
jgi:stalled ribosome rescue protein Dom34